MFSGSFGSWDDCCNILKEDSHCEILDLMESATL